MPTLASALLAALLAAGGYDTLQLAPPLPKADGKRGATIVTYMMSDDPITAKVAARTMEALLKAKGPPTAFSVVFRDQRDQGALLTLLPDQKRPSVAEGPMAHGITKVQSNNPTLLSKVLGWSYSSYPSDRRYLDVLGHGSGAFGLGTDADQTELDGSVAEEQLERMSIKSFARALREGAGKQKIDLVLFRACLMGNIEALYEISPTVRYAVGSSQPVTAVETVATALPIALQRLVRLGKPPELIARALAAQAMARPKKLLLHSGLGAANEEKVGSGFTSVVAVDLQKLDQAVFDLAQLVKQIDATLNREPAAVQQLVDAYEATPRSRRQLLGDLWAFVHQIEVHFKAPQVIAAARKVRASIDRSLLYEKDKLGEAHGLSFFMPERRSIAAYLDREYKSSLFDEGSHWRLLLAWLDEHKQMNASPARVKPKKKPQPQPAH